MRSGGGKKKGSGFERKVCKQLSLWVTKGKKSDVFWRSAMSGGRATVYGKKVRQAGDIASVAPEGHALTDHYIVECKFLKEINLAAFIIDEKGKLQGIWQKLLAQCRVHGRMPMLVVKQNKQNVLVMTVFGTQKKSKCALPKRSLEIGLFSDLLKQTPPRSQ